MYNLHIHVIENTLSQMFFEVLFANILPIQRKWFKVSQEIIEWINEYGINFLFEQNKIVEGSST